MFRFTGVDMYVLFPMVRMNKTDYWSEGDDAAENDTYRMIKHAGCEWHTCLNFQSFCSDFLGMTTISIAALWLPSALLCAPHAGRPSILKDMKTSTYFPNSSTALLQPAINCGPLLYNLLCNGFLFNICFSGRCLLMGLRQVLGCCWHYRSWEEPSLPLLLLGLACK